MATAAAKVRPAIVTGSLASSHPDRLRAAETLLGQTVATGLAITPGGRSQFIGGARTREFAFAYGPEPAVADIVANRPAWARGLRAGALEGPFTDALGRAVVLGSMTAVPVTTLMSGGQAIGYFTGSVFVLPMPPPIPPTIAELGAGTVWLRANLIDPASPADALVGVTITFGLLTSGVVSVSSSKTWPILSASVEELPPITRC